MPYDTPSFEAGRIEGIKQVELNLTRKLERPDVRKSDDEWNDVAVAIAFCLDRRARFVTGQVLQVCGGSSGGPLPL